MSLDNTKERKEMKDSRIYENMSKNVKEIERIEIGLFRIDRTLTKRIFYMALPPEVFIPVSQGLRKHVYPEKGIARLIVSPRFSSLTYRSKNHSATILNPPANSKKLSNLTGKKRRYSIPPSKN